MFGKVMKWWEVVGKEQFVSIIDGDADIWTDVVKTS